MRRIMIDIETMSTDTSNALILSVGAVEFALHKRNPVFLDQWSWLPNLRHQLALGRATSANTITWWLAPERAAARTAWLVGSPTPLRVFADGLRSVTRTAKEVWANGVAFDLSNIAALVAQIDNESVVVTDEHGKTPWKYNAASDARTIYKHTAQLRERPADLDFGPAHDAVADCKNQIWGLWEHWPEDDLPNAGSGGEG